MQLFNALSHILIHENRIFPFVLPSVQIYAKEIDF